MQLLFVVLASSLPCLSHALLPALFAESPVESRCFTTSPELTQAVDAYLFDNSSDTDVAAVYGWPIGTWCVDAIENFDGLFSRLRNRRVATFNEDLSSWNVSKATSMKRMFLLARDFDQDLCAWGGMLDVGSTSFGFMFRGTSCPTKVAPSVDVIPSGPFCHYCFSPVATNTPSVPPSGAPSMEPTLGFGCFQNRSELKSAVDSYMRDSSSDTDVARTYGWPIGSWCVGGVTDFSRLFSGYRDFNEDIGEWNVSSATTMEYLFSHTGFNQPIENWDVSNVLTMAGMFSWSPFNQPIENWDVSSATTMESMFDWATSFNQPIGDWDVSNVLTMEYMFIKTPFNQPLENWNVSNVLNMGGMFGSSNFNQPIENWDVSKLQLASFMFTSAPFNQPLENWDTSSLYSIHYMFADTPFNQPVGNWDVTSVHGCSSVFERSKFNQPLGDWNLSSCHDGDAVGMFRDAVDFDQNLCAFGEYITTGEEMFANTACPNTSDPDPLATPPGPFCYNC